MLKRLHLCITLLLAGMVHCTTSGSSCEGSTLDALEEEALFLTASLENCTAGMGELQNHVQSLESMLGSALAREDALTRKLTTLENSNGRGYAGGAKGGLPSAGSAPRVEGSHAPQPLRPLKVVSLHNLPLCVQFALKASGAPNHSYPTKTVPY